MKEYYEYHYSNDRLKWMFEKWATIELKLMVEEIEAKKNNATTKELSWLGDAKDELERRLSNNG